MKNTKIIALGNMKGGVGKSTMTSMIANYIHNQTDYSVCVIDSDDMQQTLSMMRNIDKEKGADETELYALVGINSSNFAQSIQAVYGEFDFIFVDLPGNLKQEGVIQCYAMCDSIVIPTALSDADLDSTLKFHQLIIDEIKPIRTKADLETQILFFLNKINAQTIEYKNFMESKEKLGIEFLENFIPYNTVDFQRNASTVKDYNKPQYNVFCDELLNKLL